MKTTTRLLAVTAIALSGLALTGCGGEAEEEPGNTAQLEWSNGNQDDDQGDDGQDDDQGDDQGDDGQGDDGQGDDGQDD